MDDEQMDEYLARSLALIEEYGHMVCYVGPAEDDEDTNPFAYTIGLSASSNHGYELVIAGLDPETSRNVLNATAEVLKGHNPEDGALVDRVIVDLPVKLHKLPDNTGDYGTIRMVYGQNQTMWQIQYPDEQGRFPGDPGYDLPAHLQQL